MLYLNLKASSAGTLLCEKNLGVRDLFDRFTAEFVDDLVQDGLLRYKDSYLASVRPGFETEWSESTRTEDSADSDALPEQEWWLELKGESPPSLLPIRFFEIEVWRTGPLLRRIRRCFGVGQLQPRLREQLAPFIERGVLPATGEFETTLYVCAGSESDLGRETVHVQPEPRCDVRVAVRAPSDRFVTAALPVCHCGKVPEGLGIYFAEGCFPKLCTHVANTGTRLQESGGVLIGEVYAGTSGELSHVSITEFIPARETQADAVSLRFTHETWLELHAEKQERCLDGRIVGWYHTHPPLKLQVGPVMVETVRYFSADDIAMHMQLFKKPWQVGLTIDAESDDVGCFAWSGNMIEQTSYHSAENCSTPLSLRFKLQVENKQWTE